MLRRDRSVYRSGFARFGPTESARESNFSAFSESSILPGGGEGDMRGEGSVRINLAFRISSIASRRR